MRQRLFPLVLHLCILFVLMYGYEHYIAPIYGYEGYVFDPHEEGWYAALAMVTVMSLITPVAPHKPSTLFYQVMLTNVIIPMIVLYWAGNRPFEYLAQVMVAYCLAIFLPFYFKIKPPHIPFASKSTLRSALFVLSCAYIVAIFALGGGAYLNFDFTKVYEFRGEAASNLPGIFGYISPLIAKIIVPVAFVLALLQKKYGMALIVFGATVLIFGLTAHKSTIFIPFMLLFVYAASSGKHLIGKLLLGILAVLVLSVLDFWGAQHYEGKYLGWAGDLMLRRLFFIPAHLNYLYYDFFSQHGPVLFSNSKVTLGLLEYPYPLDVPHLIGSEYFYDETTGANTGWLGSGYMQAGFAGLVLYAFIVAAVFKYIDACARQSGDRALITAAVIAPILAVINSADLPPAFLTHGLYINLLLIACLSNRSSNAHSSYEQRARAQRYPHFHQAMPQPRITRP